MPLSVAKPQLEQAIKSAFEKALSTGKNAGEEDRSTQIRNDLAKDLAEAIDVYVKSAQVNITSVVSTVPPGVPVVAPAPAGTGATVGPGIAQHAGFGNLQ
jgi:hypothetical protein